MVIQELTTYIQSQTQKGMAPESIKTSLSQSGWQQLDIDQAFQTIQSGALPLNYVGFWRRFFAFSLDGIILSIVFGVLTPIPTVLNLYHAPSTNYGTNFGQYMGTFLAGSALLFTIEMIIAIIYFAYFWSSQNGQTLGNKALGIRVVNENNTPISFIKGIARYILLVIFAIPPLDLILLITLLTSDKKQGIHDKLVHTVVIRKQ